MTKKNKHIGSTLDDFLKEEGIYESAKVEAATRVISWQLAEEMLKKGERLVNKGKANIRVGRKMVKQGQKMMEKSESSFQE